MADQKFDSRVPLLEEAAGVPPLPVEQGRWVVSHWQLQGGPQRLHCTSLNVHLEQARPDSVDKDSHLGSTSYG